MNTKQLPGDMRREDLRKIIEQQSTTIEGLKADADFVNDVRANNKVLERKIQEQSATISELLELVSDAFIAGRSKTSWEQFKKDYNSLL